MSSPTFKIDFQYLNPNNIEAEVPGEQKLRGGGDEGTNEIEEPTIESESKDNEDKVEITTNDEDGTLVPVMTVTKKEAAYTKGDLKLQKVSVTENVSEPEDDHGVYSRVLGSHLMRTIGKNVDHHAGADSPPLVDEEVEETEDKKNKTKIPILKFRQAVDTVKMDRRASEDKRETETKHNLPSKTVRRSSIPIPQKDGRIPVPTEKTPRIANDTNDETSGAENEFDKLYDEIVHDGQEGTANNSLLDANKLESKFEDIIHDYDDNKNQPITVEKVKSKIPLLKRRSEQEIEVPKPIERRSSLKKPPSLEKVKTKSIEPPKRQEARTSLKNKVKTIIADKKSARKEPSLKSSHIPLPEKHGETVKHKIETKESVKVIKTDLNKPQNDNNNIENNTPSENTLETPENIDKYIIQIENEKDTNNTNIVTESETVNIKELPEALIEEAPTTNDNTINEITSTERDSDNTKDIKVLEEEKDKDVKESTVPETKVTRLINRMSSIEGLTEAPKREPISELPKKKSVLSKIAMFERQDPAQTVTKLKISRSFNHRQQKEEVEHKPKIIEEILKTPLRRKPGTQEHIEQKDPKPVDSLEHIIKDEAISKQTLIYEKVENFEAIESELNANDDNIEDSLSPTETNIEPILKNEEEVSQLIEAKEIELTVLEDKVENEVLTENPEIIHQVEPNNTENVVESNTELKEDTNIESLEETPTVPNRDKDINNVNKEKDRHIDEMPGRLKVSRLINMITSHEVNPQETHKMDHAKENPKKKSVLSKIAMFERHEPTAPIFKPRIPRPENDLIKNKPYDQGNKDHREIKPPVIVEEVLKPAHTLEENVSKEEKHEEIEREIIPPAHTLEENVSKEEEHEEIERENIPPVHALEENVSKEEKREEIERENIPPVHALEENVSKEEEHEEIEKENIPENEANDEDVTSPKETEAEVLINDENVIYTTKDTTKIESNIEDIKEENSMKDVDNDPELKDQNETIKSEPIPLDSTIENESLGADVNVQYNKVENATPIDVVNAVVVEEVITFNANEMKLNAPEDIAQKEKELGVTEAINIYPTQNGESKENRLYRSKSRDDSNMRRTKSTAELYLGDSVKGLVHKMIIKMDSVEKLDVQKKEVISAKERPLKRSVSQKIALFEVSDMRKLASVNTEERRDTHKPVKTEPKKNVEVKIISEEEYAEKITELNNAKLKYGRVTNMPALVLRDGVVMPLFAVGTALLDPRLTRYIIGAAIDLGYRAIDTGYIYGNEKEVGEAIRAKIEDGTVQREELFIISKLWSTFHHPDLVEEACRSSLDTMGLDYFDSYLIHNPMSFKEGGDPIPKIANVIQFSDYDYMDAWFAMEKLVQRGLVRSIGVSNFNSMQISRIVDKGRIKPSVNQIECHPYLNQQRLDDYCDARDIRISCFGVLGSKGTPAEFKSGLPPVIDDPLVKVMAAGLNVTPAQLLIRYQIERGHSVIVKSSSGAHLWDNLRALEFSLTMAQVEALNALNRGKRMFTFRGMGDTHKNYPFRIPF